MRLDELDESTALDEDASEDGRLDDDTLLSLVRAEEDKEDIGA